MLPGNADSKISAALSTSSVRPGSCPASRESGDLKSRAAKSPFRSEALSSRGTRTALDELDSALESDHGRDQNVKVLGHEHVFV